MKVGAAPPPPDPKATAQAQADANSQAAQTQQRTNMVDQITPYGSLNYTQDGFWTNAKGENIGPRYTATTSLSPQEQAKQEQQWQFDSLVNQLGIDQTKKLQGLLSEPVSLNNEATEARLFELGRSRLDPSLDQRWQSIETDLANKGISENSEAYRRELERFNQGRNDAYNQLLLTGRGQAVQELLAGRNQPINEITALMSGGQVSQPNFINTPTASVAAPDIGGMTYQSYQMGPMAQYQAQQQSNQAMMGALGSAAGMAMGGWARSDRRLKENIEQVGRLDNGLPIYRFNYIGLPERHVGLMAQDVELVHPQSVRTVDGFKEVHYPTAVL